MSIDRYYQQFTPVCDCCGARLPGGEKIPPAMLAGAEELISGAEEYKRGL